MFMPRWQRLDDAVGRVNMAMRRLVEKAANRTGMAAAKLAGLSPLAVLSRGYAVVLDSRGRALLDADDAKPGDRVTAVLAKGRFEATVRAAPGG